MEYCEDSPKKKKQKCNKKSSSTRECVIHVFKDEAGSVSQFSEQSWKVT